VASPRATINLDENVVAIFEAEAFLGGRPYQVAIIQALRSYSGPDRSRHAQIDWIL
jgi:hypothetical protein